MSIQDHAPFCRDRTDLGACWNECCCTVQGGSPYTSGCPIHDVHTAAEAAARIASDGGLAEPPRLQAVPRDMDERVAEVLAQAANVEPLPEAKVTVVHPDGTSTPVIGMQTGHTVDPCPNDNHACDCICDQPGHPVKYDERADGKHGVPTATTSKRARAILEHAASLVDGDRNVDYGDAKDQFAATGRMWAEVLGTPVSAEQVALCMALVKIVRLTTNTGHADSWTDGAGYLGLGGGIAEQS